MIKFSSLTANGLLIGLGISDQNVELLKKGKPITVDLMELGITEPIEIMIFHGETEEKMAKMLMDNFEINQIYRFKDKHQEGG
jgi:hypothetical protein